MIICHIGARRRPIIIIIITTTMWQVNHRPTVVSPRGAAIDLWDPNPRVPSRPIAARTTIMRVINRCTRRIQVGEGRTLIRVINHCIRRDLPVEGHVVGNRGIIRRAIVSPKKEGEAAAITIIGMAPKRSLNQNDILPTVSNPPRLIITTTMAVAVTATKRRRITRHVHRWPSSRLH